MRAVLAAVGRRRRWVDGVLVLAVLAAGLVGSAAVAAATERVQRQHAGRFMDEYADDVRRTVSGELSRYRDTLADLAAGVGAQPDLTATGFTQITGRLTRQRLPGAAAVGFVVAADDAQVPATQAYWRAHGAFGLRLDPAGHGEHMFIVFNRALDATPSAVGLDAGRSPEAAAAMRTSRDSNQVTASRGYVLLKDRSLPEDQQQMAFVLAAPVFQDGNGADPESFRGWLVMAMRGGDFVDESLWAMSRDMVTVRLVDLTDGPPEVIASPPVPLPAQAGPLVRHRTIAVGNRRWQVEVQPTQNFMAAAGKGPTALAFSLGGLITLLLTALVGILAGTRRRAVTKVQQATAALRADIERRKATEARLREREDELRHLALHDPLTGLANRALFFERLAHAIVTHNRSGDTLAVLFVDLDGFKQINDNLGHHAGDGVLVEAAARLGRCVRSADTVARIGGDEFAILAERVSSPADAETVADHVVRALQAPFAVGGRPVAVTASVGVALRAPGTRSADEVLHRADAAMYAAKTAGKCRYLVAGLSS
jgi:diguanylate cyclase (GGDEF)-like protein